MGSRNGSPTEARPGRKQDCPASARLSPDRRASARRALAARDRKLIDSSLRCNVSRADAVVAMQGELRSRRCKDTALRFDFPRAGGIFHMSLTLLDRQAITRSSNLVE